MMMKKLAEISVRVLAPMLLLFGAGCTTTDVTALGAPYKPSGTSEGTATIVVFADQLPVAMFRKVDILVNGETVGHLESRGVVVAGVEPGEITVAVRAGESHPGVTFRVEPGSLSTEYFQSAWIGVVEGGRETVFELKYAGGVMNLEPFTLTRVDSVPEGGYRLVEVEPYQEPAESPETATLTFDVGKDYGGRVLRRVYINDKFLGEIGGAERVRTVRVGPGEHQITCRWHGLFEHPSQFDACVASRSGLRQRSFGVRIEPGQQLTAKLDYAYFPDLAGPLMECRFSPAQP